ncbi:MAG: pYEATS domain-containing protein [Methanothrix sp.]
MKIEVKQSSKYKGNDRWTWSIWLEGATDDYLDKIEYVEYTLHPTFSKPVRRVIERRTGFQLNSSGWGEFEIYIRVQYKNGSFENIRHWLKLDYPPIPKLDKESKMITEYTAYISSSIADRSIAQSLRDMLGKHGIRVAMLEDSYSTLPLGKSLDSLLERTLFALVIISDRSSPWITEEIAIINSHQIPIILISTSKSKNVMEKFQLSKSSYNIYIVDEKDCKKYSNDTYECEWEQVLAWVASLKQMANANPFSPNSDHTIDRFRSHVSKSPPDVDGIPASPRASQRATSLHNRRQE